MSELLEDLEGSGNIAIFKTDLRDFNAAFDLQKKKAKESGTASFGKQEFLGKCLKEILPHIQDIIFNGKKLTIDNKDIEGS